MALNKDKKAQIIKEFARDSKDTGSPEVQIAILTNEIMSFLCGTWYADGGWSAPMCFLRRIKCCRAFLGCWYPVKSGRISISASSG